MGSVWAADPQSMELWGGTYESLESLSARAQEYSSKGDTGNQQSRAVASLLGCFLLPGSRNQGRGEKLQADLALSRRPACVHSGVQVNSSLNFGTVVLTDVSIS